MSSKTRVSSALESATLSVNEKILKECHELYSEDEIGLIAIAKGIGINLLAPRKKITVMLIGNHSAGKSSFINWYVEEHVQRTGVAIETQGFAIITSGKKRESLTGNATLHLYPHLQPLQKLKGVMEYLGTEVTTSKQKKFSLVTFIDTPGLVDGDMKYPFNVNESILWIGENIADLIFVFFDPIGQALCKRTLNIVEQLSEQHAEKMKFYLSKADEAGHESDRQRVMMQIVQELCKRPSLNRTGFEMPTIFVPTLGKQSRCVNQIESACKEIEKTINATIQNTLNTLERDCHAIANKIDKLIEKDNYACSYNLRAKGKGFMFFIAALFVPFIMLANFLIVTIPEQTLRNTLGASAVDVLKSYTSPISMFWASIPSEYFWYSCLAFFLVTLILLIAARLSSRSLPTISRRRKKNLLHHRDFVLTEVKQRKETLYKDYLKQSVTAQDI